MARLGAAVTLVATDGPHGRTGLTATAVCSVTDDPPTLLVCVNRQSSSLATILGNGSLAVNVLRECHNQLAKHFSSRAVSPAERFAIGTWFQGQTGSPILADAMVSFDCRVTESVNVGSHSVLYCAVENITEYDGRDGLFYFDRNFCGMAQMSGAAA